MGNEAITALSGAFAVDKLIAGFTPMAPWILGIAVTVSVFALLKRGMRKATGSVSKTV